MTLSRDDQKEFEIFSSRVKELLQHFLSAEADLFDVLSAQLSDDDKMNLMHVGELEAAAIVLGQNSNSLFDQNPQLAEAYREQMQRWMSQDSKERSAVNVSAMVPRDTVVDLIEELDLDLDIIDEDDKDELLNALESAQATLANFKAEVGVGKTRARR